jgi:hypothetical protein
VNRTLVLLGKIAVGALEATVGCAQIFERHWEDLFPGRRENSIFWGRGRGQPQGFLPLYSRPKKVEKRAPHNSNSVKNAVHYGSLSVLSSYAVLILLVRYFR